MDLQNTGLHIFGMEKSPVQAETSAATIQDYYIPTWLEVINWGVILTEDFVTISTDWVVGISKLDKQGGTVTAIDTLTVGNGNTNLFRGDGDAAQATVISLDTDLDNGHMIIAQSKSATRVVSPGQILRLKVVTASNTAGGAGVVWAQCKLGGMDPRLSTVWAEK